MMILGNLLLLILATADGQMTFYPVSPLKVEYIPKESLSAGDPCPLPLGPPGVCTPINNCRTTSPTLSSSSPPICFYQYFVPVICCPQQVDMLGNRQAQFPEEENSSGLDERSHSPQPPQLPQPLAASAPGAAAVSKNLPDFTAVGARSRRACQEYFYMLKDQPKKTDNNMDDLSFTDKRIVPPGSRPHMALIGFGKKQRIYWRCSGSLISPRYVLAPGHCVASRRHGAIKWIMLGVVDPYDTSLPAHAQLFSVEHRQPVPGFNPPSLHNDLSLLRLDRDAELSQHVRPACLTPIRPPLGKVGTVPGWELVDWVIEPTRSRLKEVVLEVLPDQACADAYEKKVYRLEGHYSDEHLMCVGNHRGTTTDCERDTGGPFHTQTSDDLFIISGVVIFGNTVCERRNNTPVITTDIAGYLGWIEDHVWPLEGQAQRSGPPTGPAPAAVAG